MRSFLVVCVQSAGWRFSDLIQARQQLGVQLFRTVRPIEALDERVLIWLPWQDVAQLNTIARAPVPKCLRDQFRTIVQSDRLRLPSSIYQLFEHPDDFASSNRCVDHNRQRLSNAIIESVQRSKA